MTGAWPWMSVSHTEPSVMDLQVQQIHPEHLGSATDMQTTPCYRPRESGSPQMCQVPCVSKEKFINRDCLSEMFQLQLD